MLGLRAGMIRICFFFNDTATTEIYTLSLHDALPISAPQRTPRSLVVGVRPEHHRETIPAQWLLGHRDKREQRDRLPRVEMDRSTVVLDVWRSEQGHAQHLAPSGSLKAGCDGNRKARHDRNAFGTLRRQSGLRRADEKAAGTQTQTPSSRGGIDGADPRRCAAYGPTLVAFRPAFHLQFHHLQFQSGVLMAESLLSHHAAPETEGDL